MKDAKEEQRAVQRRGRRGRSPAAALSLSLALLVVIYGVALAFLRPPSPGRELSLDALTRASVCARPSGADVDAAGAAYCQGVGQPARQATFLDQDARIVGRLAPAAGGAPISFWTSYPSSDAVTNGLLQALVSSGARVRVDSQTPKATVRFLAQFVLPLVVLANLFALLFYLIQGRAAEGSAFLAFTRAGDRRQKKNGPDVVTFADVAAADEAVTELAEVRDYLSDPSAFAEMGALPPKGVLLFGPPGCGKTLLARAVAGEAQASFFSMSGSEFVEALVGVGAARVRDLFAQARAHAPAIVFIDELDAVGRQRGAGLGQGHDEREQTLNELLVQMDGFSPAHGVVAMGATNRPDILDPALLRAGRFDRHIILERPDVEGRREVLAIHARGRRLANPEADVAEVARATSGFTGADLANVMNEAALLAVRERAGSIERHHLDEAVERVMGGPKRRGRVISEEEKAVIAYHEAGHAVVAAALGKASALRKTSIVARGGRGIGHLGVLAEDKTVYGRADMEAQVAMAMAGFAAEELARGEPSTGAEQDLERATTVARDMAGRYGMSTRLGPVRVLRENREVFLGRDYLAARDVSPPTLEHLDAEVRRIVEDQTARARAILASNRATLDDLAGALVARETLQGRELQAALAGVRPEGSTRAQSGDGRAPGPVRRGSAAR